MACTISHDMVVDFCLARGLRAFAAAVACVGRMIYLTGGLAPSVVSFRDENKVIHLYDVVMQFGDDVPIHGFDGDVNM
jgi:hypothetical protein